MSSEHRPQERTIAEKCELLIKLIRDISPPPPNHLWLLNRLAEIKPFSQTHPDEARNEFEAMMRDLLERNDGAGGFILSAERYKRYFD
jgi:hypothetical protein